MNDEVAFLTALRADPADATLLLVYADWLEERGDVRAEYIRLSQAPQGNEARIEELRREFDPAWLAVMDERGVQTTNVIRVALEEIDREWQIEKLDVHTCSHAPNERPRIDDLREIVKFILIGGCFLALGLYVLWLDLSGQAHGYHFVFFLVVGPIFCFYSSAILATLLRREFRYRRAWRAYQQRRAQAAARLRNPPPA